MRDALIVFAKVPRPGKVKTRLSPNLSPGDATALYRAFLDDALEDYKDLTATVRLYLVDAPSDGEWQPPANEYFIQEGRGLGERMSNAFRETFEAGFSRACIIGTDHPTLPLDTVTSAFDHLELADVVIGPSVDGGYYLIGMSTLQTAVFTDMTYSHSSVFVDTMERATAAGLSVKRLPEWYDVDDVSSLRRLFVDLRSSAKALHRSRAEMQRLAESYGPDLFDEKSA